MYVCTYVRMYVCTYVLCSMYVRMYVRMHVFFLHECFMWSHAHAARHLHKEMVTSARWNLNGNHLLTSSRDKTIKIFDIRKMQVLQEFRGNEFPVECASDDD